MKKDEGFVIITEGFKATLTALKEVSKAALKMSEDMERVSRIASTDTPEPELTTEEKVDMLSKTMCEYGISAQEFIDGFHGKERELQSIIRKSEETWVSRYDGVDYLCIKPIVNSVEWAIGDFNLFTASKKGDHDNIWLPISEIEITDEIAKLRPVVVEGGCLFKLFGVSKYGYAVFYDEESSPKSVGISNIRLATVSDLEDNDLEVKLCPSCSYANLLEFSKCVQCGEEFPTE